LTDDVTEVTDAVRRRLDELLDEYRERLLASLDGLSEEEARRNLVPSRTTLLGLLKHVTYVEGIWFDQAVTGRTTAEIGIASTPDRSFVLGTGDTIEVIRRAYRRAIEASRVALVTLEFDAVMTGRAEHAVWALQLQVLRELAHHCGHADILREQVLSQRGGVAGPRQIPS
jgi:hypothetical protein